MTPTDAQWTPTDAQWERAPEHDRRFAWGDDYAGDAWRNKHDRRIIKYTAVNHGPAIVTAPTDAQIERAKAIIWERIKGLYINDDPDTEAECLLMTRAALTAAAEVGPNKDARIAELEELVADRFEVKLKMAARISELETAVRAAEIGPAPHFWSGAEEVRLATIERCAQVARDEPEAPGEIPQELYLIPLEDAIRAAIRATKKSIESRIRALKD